MRATAGTLGSGFRSGSRCGVSSEDAVTLRWYEYLLKGIQNEYSRREPVKMFVMGVNEWRTEDSLATGASPSEQSISYTRMEGKFS